MSDGSTVEYKGWFQRLSEAIIGVGIGLLLFVVSFPLLFWNEGRAVRMEQDLAEGAAAVVSVSADKVETTNDKKLVHMTGMAATTETLVDPDFNVKEQAVRLTRKVEVRQVKETISEKKEKQLGGGEKITKTPSYTDVWSDSLIDSSRFMDDNKKGVNASSSMPFQDLTVEAKKVTVGAFTLSEPLIKQITKSEPVPLTDASASALPKTTLEKLSENKPTAEKVDKPKVSDNSYYTGSPSSPKVGDVRISFTEVKPTTVSLMARQLGDTFEGYSFKNGNKMELLVAGTQSAEEMFKAQEAANAMLTWILRFVGFLIMGIGIGLVFKPLVIVADVIPILGNMLSLGVTFFAFAIAAPMSLVTIALGWVVYRPLLGIGLLVVAGGIFVGLFMLTRGRKKATA